MQMSKVNCQYGAPMGRRSTYHLELSKKLRCFRVNLDSGGYDDGGAYWGIDKPLYCIQDCEGNQQFLRAYSREDAIKIFKSECSEEDVEFYKTVVR